MPTKEVVLGCVVILAATLGACGGPGSPATSQEADEVAELRIVANDFSFEMPSEIAAGETKPYLRNDGEYPHQALIYKLEEGVEFAEFQRGVTKDETLIPQWSDVSGGVARTVSAGDSASSLSEDLAPGTYAVICFAHIGTEPNTHAEVGMMSELTVR